MRRLGGFGRVTHGLELRDLFGEVFALALGPEQDGAAEVDAVSLVARPLDHVVALEAHHVPVGQPGVRRESAPDVFVLLHLRQGHGRRLVDPVRDDGVLALEVDVADGRHRDFAVGVEEGGKGFHLGPGLAVGPFDVVERLQVLVLEQPSLVGPLLPGYLLQVGVVVLLAGLDGLTLLLDGLLVRYGLVRQLDLAGVHLAHGLPQVRTRRRLRGRACPASAP